MVEQQMFLEWTGDTLTGVNGNTAPGTNQFVVSGIPSVNITSTTDYPFEVKTNGSACAPEVILSGTIQVKPLETLSLASDPLLKIKPFVPDQELIH